MSDNIFTGTIPALMTPCTADRQPDFDALVKKGKELVALGMRAVVYCGSMVDQSVFAGRPKLHRRGLCRSFKSYHLYPT